MAPTFLHKRVRMALILATGALVGVACQPGGPSTIERVNVSSSEQQSSGFVFSYPALSADGRLVAFDSTATDLVPGVGGRPNIFLRDVGAGTTELVSVSTTGTGGDDASFGPAMSADGRFVAHRSFASDLVAGDTNDRADIFVRDRLAGTTERVSLDSAEGQLDDDSFDPDISADGRFVAYQSLATDAVVGDTNGARDVFVRDRLAGTTERVSVDTAEAQVSNNDFPARVAISGDGRYVAFQSDAGALVPADSNGRPDVFLRDRSAGTTERVSIGDGEGQAAGSSSGPDVSHDGRFVSFISDAPDLVPDDTNGRFDLFVRDRTTGTTTRASVAGDESEADGDTLGAGNSAFSAPKLTADGRCVIFAADATNLVRVDVNQSPDVFVRDLDLGTTTLVSVNERGGQGRATSASPAISDDGSSMAFISFAPNLVRGDTNGDVDVFLRRPA